MNRLPPRNGSSEALNERGIELADRGWLDEALREFGRAIELDRDAPFPRINRASVFVEQGRMLEALEDLLSAVRIAPDDPATHYHLGLFLTRHGAEFGIQALETCLSQEPDHIDALIQLGATHADQGDFGEAEDALSAALQLDPDDPLACWEYGILLLDQNEVHEAIRYLRHALDRQPDDLELTLDLALAYIQAGFLDQSERLLNTILEREPDHLHANYNLAAIWAKRGKADPSLVHLKRALEVDGATVREWLQDDPLFESLVDDTRFRESTANPPDVG